MTGEWFSRMIVVFNHLVLGRRGFTRHLRVKISLDVLHSRSVEIAEGSFTDRPSQAVEDEAGNSGSKFLVLQKKERLVFEGNMIYHFPESFLSWNREVLRIRGQEIAGRCRYFQELR